MDRRKHLRLPSLLAASWARSRSWPPVVAARATKCTGDWQHRRARLDDRGDPAESPQEGAVNIVQWPTYADARRGVRRETGCTVNTKDAGTGDEMITLSQSGEYDGVSASGHTSVRLMEAGDVAPVNADLLPNYADITEGIKNQPYNSNGRRALRRAARTRAELADVPDRRGDAGCRQLVGDLRRGHAVQGEDLDLRRHHLPRRRCALPQGDAAGPRHRGPVPADRSSSMRSST